MKTKIKNGSAIGYKIGEAVDPQRRFVELRGGREGRVVPFVRGRSFSWRRSGLELVDYVFACEVGDFVGKVGERSIHHLLDEFREKPYELFWIPRLLSKKIRYCFIESKDTGELFFRLEEMLAGRKCVKKNDECPVEKFDHLKTL